MKGAYAKGEDIFSVLNGIYLLTEFEIMQREQNCFGRKDLPNIT
jgi:hypothetical protein